MKYDITIHEGRIDRPAVIFIHGLGMDSRIWADPGDARILGGSFPLRYILPRKPGPIILPPEEKKSKAIRKRFSAGETVSDLKTSFHDLKSLGYTVTTWSQKRPAGPAEIAVEELREIVRHIRGYSRKGAILIGHSRGGLIARKYLESENTGIIGLITVATPHQGSTMAGWADYISPLASMISPLIREDDRKKFLFTIKRILNFIGGKAIKELLPDSNFLRSLGLPDCKGMYCVSIGGTNPAIFSLYKWEMKTSGKKKVLRPSHLLSFPGTLEKILPSRLYPPELRKGYGDGLVSAKSSILPGCGNHYNFSLNHAAILFDSGVREKIIKAVEAI